MHTVIETESFIRNAKVAGLSDKERTDMVNFIAYNPDAGDEIKGTGGTRKVRFAREGKRRK